MARENGTRPTGRDTSKPNGAASIEKDSGTLAWLGYLIYFLSAIVSAWLIYAGYKWASSFLLFAQQ